MMGRDHAQACGFVLPTQRVEDIVKLSITVNGHAMPQPAGFRIDLPLGRVL